MKRYKEVDDIISLIIYFDFFDILLTNNASKWAESYFDIIRLLIENDLI